MSDRAVLDALGWTPGRESELEAWRERGFVAARVAAQHTRLYRVHAAAGEALASVAGKLRHDARVPADLPAVGDWVVVSLSHGHASGRIHAVLPRTSRLSRKAAGDETQEQVLAANVDTVFLITGLDANYNPRRIERALVLVWESGARPVVLLSKADLAEDPALRVREAESVAPGVPVHAVSCRSGEGVDAVRTYVRPGQTIALLGSSGVGKSTLINHLLGEERLSTRQVREKDDRGRHTTTHRELVLLPGGGLVIDTPGLRELQLWSPGDSLAGTFDDIGALAAGCAFRDCAHDTEPDCAVLRAVAEGRLPAERLESWRKLQRELRQLELRQDKLARMAEKRKWRPIHKAMRHFNKRG